jgi:hypothetical protein
LQYDGPLEAELTQPSKAGHKTGATASSKPVARPPLTAVQVLVILGFVAGLLIMLDFNRRQAEAQRLEADRDRVSTEVALLEYERSALQTQVAYATTDAAVLDWAHEHGKLVQGNEVLVVPVLPTAAATTVPAPIVLPPAPPTWLLWWNLFSDAPPPIEP